MNRIDLDRFQRKMLSALVAGYRSTESPVNAADVGDAVDRSAGNVRTRFKSLKALGLVEGIPGPRGGYRPTAAAYDVLDYQDVDDPERLVVAHDYERVTATVDRIDLTDVHDPERCRARLHFHRPVEGLAGGDPILVGPTPISELVIGGEVEAIEGSTDEVVLDVGTMEAPLSPE